MGAPEIIRNHRLLAMTLCAISLIAGAIVLSARQRRVETLPLSSIITTSPQAGMRSFEEIFPNQSGQNELVAAGQYLRPFQTATLGASNAFLVDADNDRDAIEASKSVFFGGRSADVPAPLNQPDPKLGNYWLAAYLGIGPSGPTAFQIEKASIQGDTIRLTYSHPKAAEVTANVHPYYYWVPLGKLGAGEYQIELFSSDQQKATLLRHVVVREQKQSK